MNGADAEGLSEDNQILRINLRKAKREAEEKRARDDEARRLRELQEKKREDDERKQKEAEKARKKAEKSKEKKKRDRDGAAVSDEGEMDAPKRKKPKVGEYDPKVRRSAGLRMVLTSTWFLVRKVRKIRGSVRPPATRSQPRMRCVLQGEGKVQPVRRGLRCGTVGARRSLSRTLGLRRRVLGGTEGAVGVGEEGEGAPRRACGEEFR
jgi:hypothetical protein